MLNTSLARLVPGLDGLAAQGRNGWVLLVKVEDTWFRLLEQLATAMAQELVKSDLHFKGGVAILLIAS